MLDYSPPSDLLAGRNILVTGAGDGIGRAVALDFAAHGATVVLVGRTLARLEAVYDEIETRGLPQAAIIEFDLATQDASAYHRLAENLQSEFGRLDGLLHNAAELGALAPLELYDVDLWARVFQVNLHAPFMLTRTCLPLLKAADDASVVFTTADVGRKGRAYWGAYGVAYFGVEGLMQILADELETNARVRVNSIDPGPVNTRMRRAAYPGQDTSSLATPASITPLYLYLMGPDSRAVTGRAFSAQPEPA